MLSAIMKSFAIKRPSMSEIRSFKDKLPKDAWLVKAWTVSRAITQPTKTFDRPPSFECVIGDRGSSETASVIYSEDAPPSYTDVARRDASETASVDQNLPDVNFEEASSTPLDFGDIYQDHVVNIYVAYNGDWEKDGNCWKYKNASRYVSIAIEKETTYVELTDILFKVFRVDKLKYNLKLEVPYTVYEQSYIPVHIQNDGDVAVFVKENLKKVTSLCVTLVEKNASIFCLSRP